MTQAIIEIMVAVLTAFMGLSIFGVDPLSHIIPYAFTCAFLWLLIDLAGGVRC